MYESTNKQDSIPSSDVNVLNVDEETPTIMPGMYEVPGVNGSRPARQNGDTIPSAQIDVLETNIIIDEPVVAVAEGTPLNTHLGCMCYYGEHNLLKYIYSALVLIVGAVAIAMIIIHTGKGSAVTEGPSIPPVHTISESMVAFRKILVDISKPQLMLNNSTPQFKALRWISDTDKVSRAIYLNQNFTDENTLHVRQRYIMAVVWFSTVGENWDEKESYLSDKHVCEWGEVISGVLFSPNPNRIVCDNEQRITLLSLSSNNLHGTIPDEVGSLDQMAMFFLGGNSLEGTIPQSISNFKNLKALHLGFNLLEGNLPYLGNFTEIFFFSTWRNNLNGTLHGKGLEKMKIVENIVLGSNNISGTFPKEIVHLTELRLLNLNDNNLIGTLPSDLRELRHLTELKLCCNGLNGTLPSSMSELESLEILDVADNNLSGSIPSSFSNMSVAEVHLKGNNFVGSVDPFCKQDVPPQIFVTGCELNCSCCSNCL